MQPPFLRQNPGLFPKTPVPDSGAALQKHQRNFRNIKGMPFLSFYCQKRSPFGTANRQRKGTQSLENNRIFDFFAFPLGIYPGLRKKENMLKSLCPFRLPAAVCATKFAVRSKTFFRPIFLSIAHGFRGYRRRKAKSFFCFALHPFYAKYIYHKSHRKRQPLLLLLPLKRPFAAWN